MKKETEEKCQKWMVTFFNFLFYFLPIIIITQIGFSFVSQLGKASYPENQYKILFGGIGLMATLAGLAFALSSCTEDKKKKFDYYLNGKKFFHSVLLFVIALVSQYGIETLNLLEVSFITRIAIFFCKFFASVFSIFAIILAQQALIAMNKDFFNSWFKGEYQIIRN